MLKILPLWMICVVSSSLTACDYTGPSGAPPGREGVNVGNGFDEPEAAKRKSGKEGWTVSDKLEVEKTRYLAFSESDKLSIRAQEPSSVATIAYTIHPIRDDQVPSYVITVEHLDGKKIFTEKLEGYSEAKELNERFEGLLAYATGISADLSFTFDARDGARWMEGIRTKESQPSDVIGGVRYAVRKDNSEMIRISWTGTQDESAPNLVAVLDSLICGRCGP